MLLGLLAMTGTYTSKQQALPWGLIIANPMLQALRSLRGIGYELPTSLPHLLETLEWNACDLSMSITSNHGRGIQRLEAAAEIVCALSSLQRLTVQQCLTERLPPSFVSNLPRSVQVRWRWSWMLCLTHGVSCACTICPPIPTTVPLGSTSAASNIYQPAVAQPRHLQEWHLMCTKAITITVLLTL